MAGKTAAATAPRTTAALNHSQQVSWFGLPQKQTLRQGFEYEWFLGSHHRKLWLENGEVSQGRKRSQKRVCY